MGLASCGCGSKDNTKLSDDKRVAITVDGHDVYLDEARYYAYSAQATNEVYYIANEPREIDWNQKVESGTAQNAIKGEVLDSICRRECFYDKREEYNVKLDSDEKKEVEKNVKNYFSQTSEKLKNKINISKKRLGEVFTKDMIATKVEDIMEVETKGLVGDYYKDFIDNASVNCEKCWSDINFQQHILSKKDMEAETGLATEVPEDTEEDTTLESVE